LTQRHTLTGGGHDTAQFSDPVAEQPEDETDTWYEVCRQNPELNSAIQPTLNFDEAHLPDLWGNVEDLNDLAMDVDKFFAGCLGRGY
jgi:hypothetical protein